MVASFFSIFFHLVFIPLFLFRPTTWWIYLLPVVSRNSAVGEWPNDSGRNFSVFLLVFPFLCYCVLPPSTRRLRPRPPRTSILGRSQASDDAHFEYESVKWKKKKSGHNNYNHKDPVAFAEEEFPVEHRKLVFFVCLAGFFFMNGFLHVFGLIWNSVGE